MRDDNAERTHEVAAPRGGDIAFVDGRALAIGARTSVIALLALAEHLCTHRSVSGEPRFAVCGMGVCQECRVTIDGQAHRLACQTICRPGMRIVTMDDGAA